MSQANCQSISRRNALKAAVAAPTAFGFINSALAAGYTAEVPVVAVAADHELIELGRRLQEAWAQQRVYNHEIERGGMRDRYHSIVNRISSSAGIPDNQKEWTERHCYLHIAAHVEAEKLMPQWLELLKKDQDHWEKVDGLMTQINSLPATTITGLAVKAMAARIANRHLYNKPRNDLDWDRRFSLDLIDAVLDANPNFWFELDAPVAS
ncbi:MAG: hypothetical protein GEU95_20545 [Rhizobiales bacterium]|nr:hypothetical protein [Hyphomicrobiales bacterium]